MAHETFEVIRKNKVPWKTEMLAAWELFLKFQQLRWAEG